jgi:hypothetical protein
MGPLSRCALLLAMLSVPPALLGQDRRGIEIGVDGGFEYAFDPDLLTIAVPFQRVRAAFPSGHRLAFEPNLSFTRLSTEGAHATALVAQVGAVYEVGNGIGTFARPFAGIEYADIGGFDSETVFDLGAGIGTRSRIVDRLHLRIEATLTGRFGESGGADAALGATAGLSFYTH